MIGFRGGCYVLIDGCRLFGGMIDGIGVRNAFVKDPSIQLGGSSVLLFVSIFSGKRGYGKGCGEREDLVVRCCRGRC